MQENKVTIMITGDNINLITEMKKKNLGNKEEYENGDGGM
jgi:hypothetical protein